MKRFFVASTGTGIGKTFITCALAHQLKAAGKSVRALKPVISGFDQGRIHESDPGLLLGALGLPLSPIQLEAISPWRFKAPLSPDMAAADEARSIDLSALAEFCLKRQAADYLLVEGIGGIMTPLNAGATNREWALALGFPVILVAGSALGSLSHTLAAVHAIISKQLKLQAVVVSEEAHSTVPLERTLDTLRRFLPGDTRVCAIARLDSYPELWKYVPPLISETGLQL